MVLLCTTILGTNTTVCCCCCKYLRTAGTIAIAVNSNKQQQTQHEHAVVGGGVDETPLTFWKLKRKGEKQEGRNK